MNDVFCFRPPVPLVSLISAQKPKNVSQVEKKRKTLGGAIKCQEKGLVNFTQGSVELTLPIRTVSESNCTEHWTKKHKRHKTQQKWVKLALLNAKRRITLPCTIKLTRHAPRTLDAHDNLRISLKWILDQVCAEICQDYQPGHADNNPGFTFEYDQVKSKGYKVIILITY